jgi:RHS repeat-associated protein
MAPQHRVDAVFDAMVTDLASAPRELINPDTGDIAGRAEQSLYGRRTWHGEVSCPLLFAGQYEDVESGWVYNRFRYYDPTAGVYGAQDPLGVAPRLAGAQGYVADAITTTDPYGLYAHQVSAPPFVHTMHNKGVVGEQAADSIIKREGGAGLGKREYYMDSTGASRISDGQTANGLIEVKNMKSQSMTAQLQGAVDRSAEMGGKLDLYIAPETKLTSTVANHDQINVIRMTREGIVTTSNDLFHSETKSLFTY